MGKARRTVMRGKDRIAEERSKSEEDGKSRGGARPRKQEGESIKGGKGRGKKNVLRRGKKRIAVMDMVSDKNATERGRGEERRKKGEEPRRKGKTRTRRVRNAGDFQPRKAELRRARRHHCASDRKENNRIKCSQSVTDKQAYISPEEFPVLHTGPGRNEQECREKRRDESGLRSWNSTNAELGPSCILALHFRGRRFWPFFRTC